MANPYYIEPANPLQALMTGVQGYEGAQKRTKAADQEAAVQEAGQLYASGNTQGALARLIAGNNPQFATAIANMDLARTNADWTKTYQGGMLDVAQQNAKTQAAIAGRKEIPDKIRILRESGIDPASPEGRQALFKLDEKLSAGDKKAIFDSEDTTAKLDSTLASLKRAKEINSETFSGAGASQRGWLGTQLPDVMVPDFIADPKTAKRTVEWQKLMAPEAIQQMADTLKGATTDFELRKFTELLADPSTPSDVRSGVITRMEKLAERQREINTTRMNQLRGGSYYKPGGGQSTPQAGGSMLGGGETIVGGGVQNDHPAIAEARTAIGKGKSRAAVEKRLREMNVQFQSSDLDL